MIFVLAAVAIVTVVPLLGGRYANLAALRLQHVWLVALALGLQILIITLLDLGPGPLGGGLHVVSYALVGTFVVLNRRVRWLWVIALGWASNTAAIAANGGVMPMSPHVAEALGETTSDRFTNSGPIDDARLAVLGDVFVMPAWMPLQNSFSIGDV
ncbi:MAG: DUF5317 family protein, partial [Ilumatobacteraceae bacterium]